MANIASRAVTLNPRDASVLTTCTNASCSVPSTPSAAAMPPLDAADETPENQTPKTTET